MIKKSRGCSKESISDCFDLHENKIQHYYWNVTLCRLACLVSSVGVGEDGGLLVAEGLEAGLGLDGVPAHAGDVGGDGRDVDLALGVSAHQQENILLTSERICICRMGESCTCWLLRTLERKDGVNSLHFKLHIHNCCRADFS